MVGTPSERVGRAPSRRAAAQGGRTMPVAVDASSPTMCSGPLEASPPGSWSEAHAEGRSTIDRIGENTWARAPMQGGAPAGWLVDRRPFPQSGGTGRRGLPAAIALSSWVEMAGRPRAQGVESDTEQSQPSRPRGRSRLNVAGVSVQTTHVVATIPIGTGHFRPPRCGPRSHRPRHHHQADGPCSESATRGRHRRRRRHRGRPGNRPGPVAGPLRRR
jgi:hypothetical protein